MDAKKEEPSLQDVAKFLLGEGELNGCYFGEKPENERGNYWWRTYLRSALAQPAQGEATPEGYVSHDAYRGAMERAYLAEKRLHAVEKKLRDQTEINDRLCRALNETNGPTFMGDPVLPPADTIAVPRSEWDAMKRDAERYQYLRDPQSIGMDVYINGCFDSICDTRLDAAIDAANSTGEDV